MPEVQRHEIVIHKSNLIMHCIFWHSTCAGDILGKDGWFIDALSTYICCTSKAGTQQAVDADLETRRSLWRQQADVGPGNGQVGLDVFGWCCWMLLVFSSGIGLIPRPINSNWPKLWLVATLQLRHECWNACRVVFWSFQCVLQCVTMTFYCLTFHRSRLKQNMLAWPSMQHIVQCPKDRFLINLCHNYAE